MQSFGDAAVVVHGGGPSAVLNASLIGIIDACRHSKRIRRLYGARFGALGLLNEDWIDLGAFQDELRQQIRRAPGSVLGSSRRAFESGHIHGVLERCEARGVSTVFFTGGNGSMKTALLLHGSSALTVIGVPKTVDNDLAETDRSPGFGSAARFYAHAVRDIGADNRALPAPVTIVEVIGRNAGWVTGATALARARPDDAPHLIYFPERPPTLDQICKDVLAVHARLGRAVVAVCEGLRDPDGNPFGADVDRQGNRQHELAANLGHSLARAVSAATGLRVRSEKPGLLGRSCSLAVSEVDAQDSYRCGFDAVQAADRGERGTMIALTPSGETHTVPLEKVAGFERLLPRDWIVPAGNDAAAELIRYASRLAGPIEPLPVL
jgi:6-phosphofructokinase